MVKLGIASETAKAIVDGEAEGASKALLADYSVTPGTNMPQRTPRTPAQQDTVLQVIIDSLIYTVGSKSLKRGHKISEPMSNWRLFIGRLFCPEYLYFIDKVQVFNS